MGDAGPSTMLGSPLRRFAASPFRRFAVPGSGGPNVSLAPPEGSQAPGHQRIALASDDVQARTTQILSFVSLSYGLFAVDEDDGPPFRVRRPNSRDPSGVGEHRPSDCRSQKTGPIWTEILSRIRPLHRAFLAGGVYGNPGNTEAHGQLFRGIFVVAGPVKDRLAGHIANVYTGHPFPDDQTDFSPTA